MAEAMGLLRSGIVEPDEILNYAIQLMIEDRFPSDITRSTLRALETIIQQRLREFRRLRVFNIRDYAELIDNSMPKVRILEMLGEDEGFFNSLGHSFTDNFLWGFWFFHLSPATSFFPNSSRNGYYRFRIVPGHNQNAVCGLYCAELTQFPLNGAIMPRIIFPPISGNRNIRREDDEIIEVPSMSHMMRASLLQSAQSPAVFFDLRQYLIALREYGPAPPFGTNSTEPPGNIVEYFVHY
jgi:hypothetical protein